MKNLQDKILGGILIGVLIIFGIFTAWECLSNESNKISSGTVCYKEYKHGHDNLPGKCYLTIEGEKNGKWVTYRFAVPDTEYVKYNVGDTYPKD